MTQATNLGRTPATQDPGTGTGRFSIRRWGGKPRLIGPGGGPVEGTLGNLFSGLDEPEAILMVGQLNGVVMGATLARDAVPQTEPIGTFQAPPGSLGAVVNTLGTTSGLVQEFPTPPAPPVTGPAGWIHARSSDGQRWTWICPEDMEDPAKLKAILARLEVTPAAAPERFPAAAGQRPQFPASAMGIKNVWATILADFGTLENAQLTTKTYHLRHLIRWYGEGCHLLAACHEAIAAGLTA
jgi:hypothetical protein